MMDLGGGWQLDLWLRYVDNLLKLCVESYFDLDARISRRPNDTVEFAIVGQSLLDSRRKEFVPEFLSLTGRARRLREAHAHLLILPAP